MGGGGWGGGGAHRKKNFLNQIKPISEEEILSKIKKRRGRERPRERKLWRRCLSGGVMLGLPPPPPPPSPPPPPPPSAGAAACSRAARVRGAGPASAGVHAAAAGVSEPLQRGNRERCRDL